MKRLVIFQVLTFLFLSADIYATDLQVRIYADKNIKKFSFTTLSGSYKMIDDEHKFIIDIVQNESITFWVDGEKVKAMKNGIDLGSFNEIALNGEGLKTFFKITPDQKSVEERFYDDHLELSVENKFLRIINNVDLEHYIAGVIQSEVLGSSDDVEFFKIQAIISRTYAMNNMLKHFKDGYQLCDCVHCQAYKSRNNTPKILKAANETFGLVIVDEQKKMISAAFHSNSGGETVNSEDVWSSVTPYLKTVTDTFSLKARNAVWQKNTM